MTRSDESRQPPRGASRLNRYVRMAAAILVLWAGLAYIALPLIWRHYENQRGLEGRPMVARTSNDIPGDPINVGFVGSEREVICAFNAAGWSAANAVTLESSLRIIDSVALRRPYPQAPVSPLYYDGRVEDLAFEKQEGDSADRRHHIRLWRVLDTGAEGRPVWLASGTFDKGVGLSHLTLQVTHHISADIDAERDFVVAQLAKAGMAQETYEVAGVGPTVDGRNGGGDRYYTDGEVRVVVLSPDCHEAADKTPVVRENPWPVRMKNAVWSVLRGFL